MNQKARMTMCVAFTNKLLKFVWLNEDAIGVYWGVYGGTSDFHTSYHRDGKLHMKSPAGQIIGTPRTYPPFEKITEYVQLPSIGLPTSFQDVLPKVSEDFDREIGIVAALRVNEGETFGVLPFIIHRKYEMEFLKMLIGKFDDRAFVTVPLYKFPDLKFAVILTASTYEQVQ